MKPLADFESKLIVVTGAAGGIGRECVDLLLATVLASSPSIATLPRCRPCRPRASAMPAGQGWRQWCPGLESPAACAAAIGKVDAPIFALLHLAGIFEADEIDAQSRPVWDRAIAVNLTSAFDITGACLPHLVTDEAARLVFMASVAYRRGSFDHIGYSAAKGGIAAMVRAMSRRLGPRAMVNAVAPGIIRTAMAQDIIDSRADALLNTIPVARFGHPREVAGVVKFLCSADASYITGQVINCDGGIANG
ncbi:SDR family oxidoreductase [Aquincola sp. S2]|uniref:SDR family oxidoreductase n=1 Tax=Pseudaquabacterium terrae TaxID=2732868 RepID=A0ABX2ETU2_9BURK|nr:SDR family oxidoreductase [Aquabacterium terrae]NRF72051.1 SDR family oxidoreductase [Aquabacterium terrae]